MSAPRVFRVVALAAAVGGAYGLALRPWHLHWGATDAERSRTWPGDELVPAPYSRAIRAVTVRARAEREMARSHGGYRKLHCLRVGPDDEWRFDRNIRVLVMGNDSRREVPPRS
jgi:hypothetical protein